MNLLLRKTQIQREFSYLNLDTQVDYKSRSGWKKPAVWALVTGG